MRKWKYFVVCPTFTPCTNTSTMYSHSTKTDVEKKRPENENEKKSKEKKRNRDSKWRWPLGFHTILLFHCLSFDSAHFRYFRAVARSDSTNIHSLSFRIMRFVASEFDRANHTIHLLSSILCCFVFNGIKSNSSVIDSISSLSLSHNHRICRYLEQFEQYLSHIRSPVDCILLSGPW